MRHPRLHRTDQDRRLLRPTQEAKRQQQPDRRRQQEDSKQPDVALDPLEQRSPSPEHGARGGHGRPDLEDRRQIRKEEGPGQGTGKVIFLQLGYRGAQVNNNNTGTFMWFANKNKGHQN